MIQSNIRRNDGAFVQLAEQEPAYCMMAQLEALLESSSQALACPHNRTVATVNAININTRPEENSTFILEPSRCLACCGLRPTTNFARALRGAAWKAGKFESRRHPKKEVVV